MLLRLCLTNSVLDYRSIVFLDGEGYVRVTANNGRSLVARLMKGPCIGVSREVALMLYPYYGWGYMEVEAEFKIEPIKPIRATKIVIKVPYGITREAVRKQLEGFPIYRGFLALEYLGQVEFGEVVSVEPEQGSILTPETELRLALYILS